MSSDSEEINESTEVKKSKSSKIKNFFTNKYFVRLVLFIIVIGIGIGVGIAVATYLIPQTNTNTSPPAVFPSDSLNNLINNVNSAIKSITPAPNANTGAGNASNANANASNTSNATNVTPPVAVVSVTPSSSTTPSITPYVIHSSNPEVQKNNTDLNKTFINNYSKNINKIRYVRIEKTIVDPTIISNTFLSFAELQVFDSNGVNVALKKNAQQYSTAPEKYFRDTSLIKASETCRSANCATDGDTNGIWTNHTNGTNSITHTFLTPTDDVDIWEYLKTNNTIWWQVDLGESFTNLENAVLFNRTDVAGANLVGSRVIFMDENFSIYKVYQVQSNQTSYNMSLRT